MKPEATTGISTSPQPPQPLPEEGEGQPMVPIDIAPQFIVEIQGKPFFQFTGLLALAHALASLTADFITR